MAETVGSLVDKISISNLKIFHMDEQIRRNDVDQKHIVECQQRLRVLTLQRNDLVGELNELLRNIRLGKVRPRIYRQQKMYNNPKYRTETQ